MHRACGLLQLLLAVAACGGTEAPAKRADTRARPSPASAPARSDGFIAAVERGTVGPFLAPTAGAWLAIWAGPSPEGEPSWFSAVLDPKGRVTAPPRALAPAPPDVGLLSVEPVNGGALVVYTTRGEAAHGLGVLSLGESGELRDAPALPSSTDGELVWIDLAPTDAGALVFWGVRKANAVEIRSGVWRAGEGLQTGKAVHSSALSWQLAHDGTTALLGVVNAHADVELVALGSNAEVLSSSSLATAGPASRDLDLIATKRGFVVAFSGVEEAEPQLMSAIVGADGRALTVPSPAARPLGAQALVELVESADGYVVWNNVHQEPDRLRVARLSSTGKVDGPQLLVPLSAAEPRPEFASHGSALSTLLWSCDGQAECSRPLPVLLDLDDSLEPRFATPWTMAGAAPDLAWNLSCGDGTCVGLAASFADPTPVYLKGSGGKPGAASYVQRQAADVHPLESLHAIRATQPLADVAAVPLGGGSLLSWLTYFDPSIPYEIPAEPAPDGRRAPVRARLEAAWHDDHTSTGASGRDEPTAEVVSYRAHSPSGIALAHKADRALLAWSAIDDKHPQVFTTLLDARGKKISQRMQTRKRGDVQRVASAPTQTGWLLAWIDDRSGVAKSYLAALDERLNKRSPELQLPETPHRVVDLHLAARGQHSWLLSAVAESTERCRIELMLVEGDRLRGRAPITLAESSSCASPVLLMSSETVTAAWIEGKGGASRVMLRELADTGEPRSSARALALPGEPLELASECNADGSECALLITVRTEMETALFRAPLLRQARSSEASSVERLLRYRSRKAARIGTATVANRIWLYDAIGKDAQGIHLAEVRPAR